MSGKTKTVKYYKSRLLKIHNQISYQYKITVKDKGNKMIFVYQKNSKMNKKASFNKAFIEPLKSLKVIFFIAAADIFNQTF